MGVGAGQLGAEAGVLAENEDGFHMGHYWGRSGFYGFDIGAFDGIVLRFPRDVDGP